jgi:hypothetical protein
VFFFLFNQFFLKLVEIKNEKFFFSVPSHGENNLGFGLGSCGVLFLDVSDKRAFLLELLVTLAALVDEAALFEVCLKIFKFCGGK